MSRHRSPAPQPAALGVAGWLLIAAFGIVLGSTLLYLLLCGC